MALYSIEYSGEYTPGAFLGAIVVANGPVAALKSVDHLIKDGEVSKYRAVLEDTTRPRLLATNFND